VVLDTDALLAYSQRAESVGYQLVLVADRGESALVPAACLATAYQRVTDDGWRYLDILTSLEYVVVTPLTREDCSVLGGWARTLGLDTAQAAIQAAAHPITPLMTSQRDLVTTFLPKEWPIIDI